MENVTHSLVGAALAEVALPANATATQRRLFFVAGIVAANLPDADLVYTNITPPPLGYLLHHRGHTHTLVGCALLAIAFAIVARFIPPLQRAIEQSPRRFWLLIAAALLSHIVLDSWNIYGVHPFWPVDNRWFYGDTINIVEPWLWVLLGVSAVLNVSRARGRMIVSGILIALAIMLMLVRMISLGALVALFVGAGALTGLAWRLTPRARATAALVAVAIFVTTMFGLSRRARVLAVASLEASPQGELVDVVINSDAASPACWRALSLEKNEAAGEWVMRRANIPVISCAEAPDRAITWTVASRESLDRLRALARDDCWARAWLQFGRAPSIEDDRIADIRFGRAGFTTMRLLPPDEARVCPPHLTRWTMPRADLLERN